MQSSSLNFSNIIIPNNQVSSCCKIKNQVDLDKNKFFENVMKVAPSKRYVLSPIQETQEFLG